MNKLLLALTTLALIACTDDDRTIQTVQKQGFTDVKTTGYHHWACSEDDNFKTGFTAKNPQGVQVEGTVCCGWMKSCTIRW